MKKLDTPWENQIGNRLYKKKIVAEHHHLFEQYTITIINFKDSWYYFR